MRSDRPSSTAIVIALSLLALQRRRDGCTLVSAEDALLLKEALAGLGAVTRALAAIASSRAGGPIVRLIEWCTVPGIVRHFGVRKRLIDAIVRDAVRSGVGRVVVVAAGLDLLTRRLARDYPALSLVEIDHPATSAVKRRLLSLAGCVERVTLVTADLGVTDISTRIPESADLPTIFVAEGLTMYLDEANVGRLLDRLASVPGARQLVFTFLEPGYDSHAAFPRQRWILSTLLRRWSERFQWGCAQGELSAFVSSHGWRLERIHGAAEFGDGFAGEFIAVCTHWSRGTFAR